MKPRPTKQPRGSVITAEPPEMPDLEAIQLSVQMMKALDAPSFPTKSEKLEAIVELARALSRSRKRLRR